MYTNGQTPGKDLPLFLLKGFTFACAQISCDLSREETAVSALKIHAHDGNYLKNVHARILEKNYKIKYFNKNFGFNSVCAIDKKKKIMRRQFYHMKYRDYSDYCSVSIYE